MQKLSRLKRELSKISNCTDNSISVYPKNDDLSILEAQLWGPPDTPYEKGVFKLEVLVPENYPFNPPSIKFETKVYHPNIDDNGRVCMDLLKMPPAGGWKPTIGIEALLVAVRMLLESPNPQDPLMVDIAEEFCNRHEEFNRKAKECTQKYAC